MTTYLWAMVVLFALMAIGRALKVNDAIDADAAGDAVGYTVALVTYLLLLVWTGALIYRGVG